MPEVPNCPYCGKLVPADNVSDEDEGTRIECPHCNRKTLVTDDSISFVESREEQREQLENSPFRVPDYFKDD